MDEEWNVIGRKAGSRGKGSVRESICPCKVKKTRSSHSRVGEARLLDQVNLRSSKGNSISARLSKVWLNALASAGWKAVLFFSEGKRIRLKSPAMSHGVSSGCAIEASSSENANLREREEGA